MARSRTTLWISGASALAILLATASWFLLIGPARSEASQARSQTSQAARAGATMTAKIAQLQAAYVGLPADQAELAALRQKVPTSADLPGLVRQFQAAAGAAGVTLTSITPSAATAGSSAAPSAAPSASSTQAPRSAASTGSEATATASGLVVQPLSVVADGTFARLQVFLQQVQTAMPRAYLVNTLNLGPSTRASGTGSGVEALELTLGGDVFVLPTAAAASGATSAPTPSPTTAP